MKYTFSFSVINKKCYENKNTFIPRFAMDQLFL